MRWADIEDDDCLTCEKCGLKEWTRAYCVNCVNDTLQIMNLFQDHTDLSESAKERLYCQIVTEHRLTAPPSASAAPPSCQATGGTSATEAQHHAPPSSS